VSSTMPPPQVDQPSASAGLERLRGIAAAIDIAQDKDEQVKLVTSMLAPESRADVLAALRTPEAAAILVQIRAIRGLGRPVDDTMRQLRLTAGPAESAQTLDRLLHRAALPPLRAPSGWGCRLDGIWRLATGPDGPSQVSLRPVVVSGVLRALDSATRSLVLEWAPERGNDWERAIVRAADTQDPRVLIRLRDVGAPISARNVRDLADWFDQLLEANGSTLPRAWQAGRFGFVRGGTLGFLWGRTQITAAADVTADDDPTKWAPDHVRLDVPADDGRLQIAAGCRAVGSFEGWADAVALIAEQPRVMLALYAALAAPYLGVIVDAPNAIVDWNGETSRGKTTTLRLGASVWGRPETTGDGLMRTWDLSAAYLESVAEMMAHMPLILDDTKRATTRGKDEGVVASLIYQIATGQGRGRGKPDGVRRTAEWRTLLLSTGEAPATSFTQDAGARARVLSITGSPLPKGSRALVAELTAALLANHGHAGPRLVRHLLATRAEWGAIRTRYAAHVAKWTREAGDSAVAGRLAAILALLELGQEAAHDVLGLPRPANDPMKTALAAAIASSDDADRPAAALADVYAWAVQHEQEFWERAPQVAGVPKAPTRGWAGVWRNNVDWKEIAFEPGTLRRVLGYCGYNPDDVIPRWYERGWTKRDGKNLGHKRTVGPNATVRCVVLPREVFDVVAGLGGREQPVLFDPGEDDEGGDP
jgi:putative DNA primase/helicase